MTVEAIIKLVEKVLDIDLFQKVERRTNDLTDARIIVWKIADSFEYGAGKISEALERNRSICFHYQKKFDCYYITDKKFSEKYSRCVKALNEYLDSKEYLKEEKENLQARIKQIDELLGT